MGNRWVRTIVQSFVEIFVGFRVFVYRLPEQWISFLSSICFSRALSVLLRLKLLLRKIGKSNHLIYDAWRETVRKNPDKVAFMFEDQQWTYKEFDKYTNTIANYFYEAGFKKGDTVALFLENKPEMVAFWLGLSKVGCVAALINFNLKMESLAHCVNVSDAKALVLSVELSEGWYKKNTG